MRVLRELRNERGISQFELSKVMEVSRSTIAMWETGATQPDNDTLRRLADYFDVSVDYLLGRTDEPNPTNSKSAATEEDGEPLEGVYLRLARDAQKMKIDPRDLDYIMDMYRKIRRENEE